MDSTQALADSLIVTDLDFRPQQPHTFLTKQTTLTEAAMISMSKTNSTPSEVTIGTVRSVVHVPIFNKTTKSFNKKLKSVGMTWEIL